jgi:hypothetical protein
LSGSMDLLPWATASTCHMKERRCVAGHKSGSGLSALNPSILHYNWF